MKASVISNRNFIDLEFGRDNGIREKAFPPPLCMSVAASISVIRQCAPPARYPPDAKPRARRLLQVDYPLLIRQNDRRCGADRSYKEINI